MIWIGGLVVAIGLAGYLLGGWRAGASEADDSAPLSPRARLTLMVYLLASCAMVIYILGKLIFLDFADRGLTAEGPIAETEIETLSKGTGPVIIQAVSYLRSAGGPGSAPTYEIAIYGDRFPKEAKVRLNGRVHPPKSVRTNLLHVSPENSVFENAGSVTVEVEHPGVALSNALSLKVPRPRSTLSLFRFPIPITREIQLLLMVLCAGGLGSLLHAIKSLTDFLGNRNAISSWFWWYISRPFLGATMALIFYAVLRGGFLTGTPADVNVVNPFGAIAVAALVGMFSDKASQKLGEVFDTLFKAEDRRGGRLAAPRVDKLVPAALARGSAVPVEVKILGENLGKVTSVKVDGLDRAPEKVEERQVIVKLQPADLTKAGTLTISVVSPEGSSPAAKLKVTDLSITTKSLPAANVNASYAAPVVASGGTQPLKWAMTASPSELTIDPSTGGIGGTPKTAGAHKLTVSVTDTDGATASHEFVVTAT
jgi:hypothetical protein